MFNVLDVLDIIIQLHLVNNNICISIR